MATLTWDDGQSDRTARGAKSRRALVLLGLVAALGVAGLTALGIWQLERRVWKHALIDRVEQRVHTAPVPAAGPVDWQRITAAGDEYRHVGVTGRFVDAPETLVQAVTDFGSGFWVLAPFRTTDGFTVLVNRGFVPPDKRDPSSRAAAQTADDITIAGLLRMTEPKGGFLRSNDPAADRWFSRDVAAIAVARNLGPVAPYFIDADASPDANAFPVAGLTRLVFPDNHLVYALTWFGLAMMLAGGAVLVARREHRLHQSPEGDA